METIKVFQRRDFWINIKIYPVDMDSYRSSDILTQNYFDYIIK